MLAVEFESFELNKKIIDTCIENYIITDWFLHCSNSMRLAPPLGYYQPAAYQCL
jgi:acetylornithine/N-succinyldiaminopimelate aminotransferase